MLEIQNSYLLLYILGIIMMIVNIAQSIFRKKGKLFNPPEIEMNKNQQNFVKMRLLYGISQSIMLILYIICFVYFKNYVIAIVGFSIGNLLPMAVVFLYDSFLNYKERKNSWRV